MFYFAGWVLQSGALSLGWSHRVVLAAATGATALLAVLGWQAARRWQGFGYAPAARFLEGLAAAALLLSISSAIALLRDPPTIAQVSPPIVHSTPPADVSPTQLPTKVTPAAAPVDLVAWGKFLDPAGNCEVKRRQNQVEFVLPGSISYNLMPGMPNGDNAPRLLHEADGDFILQVRILPLTKAQPNTSTNGPQRASWRSAGLVVIVNPQTVVRLERVSWGECKAGAPMMHAEWFADGARKGDHYAGLMDDQRSTLLQIERRGRLLHLRYSDDGTTWEDWQVVADLVLPKRLQVGLVAVHATPTAFDPYFQDLCFGSSPGSGTSADDQPLLSPETIAAAPHLAGWSTCWSPDGKKLVRLRRETGELQTVDLLTGESKLLFKGGGDPAWSPLAGGPIAVVKTGARVQDEEIWLVEPDGTNPRKLVSGGYPSWSHDGKRLYFRRVTELQLCSLDIDQPAAKPTVALELPFGASAFPAASPDGTMVAFGHDGRLVVVTMSDSKQVARVEVPDWKGILPCWSPDSRYVSFGSYGWRDDRGVWLLDTKTKRVRKLAEGSLTLARWSPDGQRIAVDDRAKWEVIVLELAPLKLANGLPAASAPAASAAKVMP